MTVDRKTDRHTTDDRHDIFFQFLSPRGPKRAEKKFQNNRKKNSFGDNCKICPFGLRIYKNILSHNEYLQRKNNTYKSNACNNSFHFLQRTFLKKKFSNCIRSRRYMYLVVRGRDNPCCVSYLGDVLAMPLME